MQPLKKKRTMTSFLWRLWLLILTPTSSWAVGFGDNDPSSVLNQLVSLLTSKYLGFIAILAIAAMGYLTIFKQRFPYAAFIFTCVGLGVVFGAGYFANLLGFGQ